MDTILSVIPTGNQTMRFTFEDKAGFIAVVLLHRDDALMLQNAIVKALSKEACEFYNFASDTVMNGK